MCETYELAESSVTILMTSGSISS